MTETRPFLDRPIARVCAAGVLLCVAGALLAIHWDDLFAEEGAMALDPDDPVAICFAAEKETIDKMLADGVFNEDQAARALAGAEARCHAEFGASGPPPPPQ
jgi:hypothetical protein